MARFDKCSRQVVQQAGNMGESYGLSLETGSASRFLLACRKARPIFHSDLQNWLDETHPLYGKVKCFQVNQFACQSRVKTPSRKRPECVTRFWPLWPIQVDISNRIPQYIPKAFLLLIGGMFVTENSALASRESNRVEHMRWARLRPKGSNRVRSFDSSGDTWVTGMGGAVVWHSVESRCWPESWCSHSAGQNGS